MKANLSFLGKSSKFRSNFSEVNCPEFQDNQVVNLDECFDLENNLRFRDWFNLKKRFCLKSFKMLQNLNTQNCFNHTHIILEKYINRNKNEI